MTDLWTRFQGAVRWVGESLGNAAVAVVPASHVTDAVFVVPYASAATAAPALATDGIDIRGIKTVDLGVMFDNEGSSVVIRVYLFNSQGWFAAAEDVTITAPLDELKVYLDPLDVESWQRLAIRIITPPAADGVSIVATPEV